MRREKIGEVVIQMDWICNKCRHQNPGLEGPEDQSMRCTNCGNQKSTEAYLAPKDIQTAPAINDPALLDLANAGEHWTCKRCFNDERADNAVCSTCGCPRYEEAFGPQNDSPSFTPREAITIDDELFKNRVRMRARRGISVLIALLTVFLFVLGFNWLFRSHLTTATVRETRWERTETLRQRTLIHPEDWRDSLPTESFNLSCERKLRAYKDCDPYDCHPHQVGHECRCTGGDTYDCHPHTERTNCRDMKNGAMKCDVETVYDTCTHPRSCQTCYTTEYETCYKRCPVYDDWCTADAYEWSAIQQRAKKGVNTAPLWPGLAAFGPDQRLDRDEQYHVRLASEHDWWDLTPHTEQEFLQYPFQARFKAEYNHSGSFKILQRLP